MMSGRLTRIARLAILGILAMTVAAVAANEAPVYFWPAATDISIFKDGCAYVVREGEAQTTKDGVLTERVPRPVMGTLDVYALSPGVKVSEIVAFYDDVAQSQPITDIEGFYRQLIGRQVEIECGQQKLKGTLRAVLSPGYLLLEVSGGTMLIPLGSVTNLTLSGSVPLEQPGQGRQPRFKIRLAGAGDRVKLGISYLEESWAWYPTYRLNLRDKDQAELVLTATVVNNAEDIRGAVLHLIVGVPNFNMRGNLSPMALDVDTGVLNLASAPMPTAQAFSNRMQSAGAAAEYDQSQYSPAAPAGALEDLFVYEKKNFNLGRGERMQLELFRGVINYEPVYKWEIGLPNGGGSYDPGYLQNQGKLEGDYAGQIWHYLRLTNKTAVPWTTGPAMIVSGWQPVAQDLIKYTSVGAQHDLCVTVASDLKGACKEEEISRKVVRLANNDDYLQITVRGTITLTSYKKDAVRLEIAKAIWGALKDAGGAKSDKLPALLWNVNPETKLTWSFDLPAGGKRTITYTYDLFVNI